MKLSAVISDCQQYRYELRRTWDTTKPTVLFIGLNPSMADAQIEDPTSRVCINYAKRWGYGAMALGNLFAFRSTDSSVLSRIPDPVGPENDAWLKRLGSEATMVVCAWTDVGKLQERDAAALTFLRNPHCLKVLKSGRPGHPLYKRADLLPMPLRGVR